MHQRGVGIRPGELAGKLRCHECLEERAGLRRTRSRQACRVHSETVSSETGIGMVKLRSMPNFRRQIPRPRWHQVVQKYGLEQRKIASAGLDRQINVACEVGDVELTRGSCRAQSEEPSQPGQVCDFTNEANVASCHGTSELAQLKILKAGARSGSEWNRPSRFGLLRGSCRASTSQPK